MNSTALHIYRDGGPTTLSSADCTCDAASLAKACKQRVDALTERFARKLEGVRGKTETAMDIFVMRKLSVVSRDVHRAADRILGIAEAMTTAGAESSIPGEPELGELAALFRPVAYNNLEPDALNQFARHEFAAFDSQVSEINQYLDAPVTHSEMHQQLLLECGLFRAEVDMLHAEYVARRERVATYALPLHEDELVDGLFPKTLVNWRHRLAGVETKIANALSNPPHEWQKFVGEIRSDLNAIRQGDCGVDLYIRYYKIKLPPYLDRIQAILLLEGSALKNESDAAGFQVRAAEPEEPESMAS
jgi:hypothetical protein